MRVLQKMKPFLFIALLFTLFHLSPQTSLAETSQEEKEAQEDMEYIDEVEVQSEQEEPKADCTTDTTANHSDPKDEKRNDSAADRNNCNDKAETEKDEEVVTDKNEEVIIEDQDDAETESEADRNQENEEAENDLDTESNKNNDEQDDAETSETGIEEQKELPEAENNIENDKSENLVNEELINEADMEEAGEQNESADKEKNELPQISMFSVTTEDESVPLQKGKRHDAAIKVKNKLTLLGYESFPNATTYYGTRTETAVKQFQKDMGLSVTGAVDEETMQLLEEQAGKPLERGMRRGDAVELKQNLNKLGFTSFNNPNELYGSQTERGVKEFQELYGLDVTGIADQATLDKMDEVLTTPLRNGNRHDDAMELKHYLTLLGYESFPNATTLYGNRTETAVREFQEVMGLPVTGIADEATFNLLKEESTKPLERGMRRGDAVELKKNLNRLGFTSFNNPNELYGSQTERGIKEFQELYGLDVTGVADQATLDKMDEVLSTPLRNGNRHDDAIELKHYLTLLGYESFPNATTLYGNRTETAVREFQEVMDLPVTGVADEATFDLLKEESTKPLERGMRRADAVELKENLNKLGFTSFNNPNELYGSQTERGIREFQELHGLDVTGIADQATLDKMDEVLATPLRNGNRHDDAIELKDYLTILGYENFPNATTLYGNRTETAVKEFQKDMGLPISGIADTTTMELLKEKSTKPLERGMRRGDAVELKENLNKLGFTSFSNPNELYGSQTERGIREFQELYGLDVTGIADQATLDMMDEVLSTPLRNGNRHEDAIELKHKLTKLGYENFPNATTFYGSRTETAVKKFQESVGLPVSGIADSTTVSKMDEILSTPLQRGKRHEATIELKDNLTELGYENFPNATTLYGTRTEAAVKAFQEDMGLPVSGIADERTLEEIQKALDLRNYTQYDLTLAEALAMQVQVDPQTDQRYAYVHTDYVENGVVTASNRLNVRSGPCACDDVIGSLSRGDEVNIISEYNGWYQIEADIGGWKTAVPGDVLDYLDPTNFLDDRRLSFQFLDLSKSSNAEVNVLNSYLEGKGTLQGQGKAFIEASRKHGVNDVYLISHAILETGNGSSQLAQGVQVNGKTVYNMFGIGAVDDCPVECGSQRAYEEGWFTPYDAIVGGAQFIGNGYIKSGQNTLYKMRWNPESMENLGYASHQYATDIGWATKQVTNMYNMYKDMGIYHLVLDIPQYKS